MGIFEGNRIVEPNDWEEVKRKGEDSIKKWIDNELSDCDCVVVLIGEETYKRKWVDYEITRAWDLGKGLLGIYVHNLQDPRTGYGTQGVNPFSKFVTDKNQNLDSIIRVYNPSPYNAYNDIQNNLNSLVEDAIAVVKRNKYARL